MAEPVWWCLRHEWPSLMRTYCGRKETHLCRMVEKRLTDPGSLIVEKVDGEWPEWALHAAKPFEIVRMDDCNGLRSREPTEILDALAEGGVRP